MKISNYLALSIIAYALTLSAMDPIEISPKKEPTTKEATPTLKKLAMKALVYNLQSKASNPNDFFNILLSIPADLDAQAIKSVYKNWPDSDTEETSTRLAFVDLIESVPNFPNHDLQRIKLAKEYLATSIATNIHKMAHPIMLKRLVGTQIMERVFNAANNQELSFSAAQADTDIIADVVQPFFKSRQYSHIKNLKEKYNAPVSQTMLHSINKHKRPTQYDEPTPAQKRLHF